MGGNYGEIMEKLWENYGKIMGSYKENYGRLKGEIIGKIKEI